MQDRDEIDRRNNNVGRVNQQLDNIPERLEQRGEGIVVEHRNLIHWIRIIQYWQFRGTGTGPVRSSADLLSE